MRGLLQHVALCDRRAFTGCHVLTALVARVRIPFLSKAEQYPAVWMDHIVCVHRLWMDPGLLSPLPVVNECAVNAAFKYPCETPLSVLTRTQEWGCWVEG